MIDSGGKLRRATDLAVATILTSAAFLKLTALATPGVVGGSVSLPVPLEVGSIVAETSLAVWLAAGCAARAARLGALVLFTIFAVVTTAEWVGGSRSCGCFGPVMVRPATTLWLDLACAAALALSVFGGPTAAPSGRMPIRSLSTIAVVILLGLLVTGAAWHWGLPTAQASAAVDPAQWVGHPLPVLSQLDISPAPTEGQWTLVFYRSDCDDCRRFLARLGEEPLMRTALVELPPFAEAPAQLPSASSALRGRLRIKPPVYMRTPCTVHLQDGVVASADGP